MWHSARIPVAAIAASMLLLTAFPASAQYFGRNKVQHRQFQFEVLTTDHFHVYFYPEEREAAHEMARMAERWYARLSQIFQHELSSPQPLIVYASGLDFRQTNVVLGGIGEGTGGVTEGYKRRVVMPVAGTLQDTDHVLGHELVHAFQYDIAHLGRDGGLGSGLGRLPLWFVEGLAEYLSIGNVDPHTAMWIRDAAREDGKLPSIGQLDHPRYFPYRWGQAFWAYVAGRWGDATIRPLLDEALRSGSPSAAVEQVLEVKAKELSEEWHAAIAAHVEPVLQSTMRASATGRRVIGDDTRDGNLAVSPALSPDGRRVVYLSERDMLSIDMYVADTETGRVIRKLVNTAIDPHFSSIQFIGSAGTWHPTGRQFAFAAVRQGNPALAIIDIESGRRIREIPFPDLGEILNPSWSPDGRSIAFSATTAGRSDLFVYDLATESVRQLTSDAYADLQPAWSPDGTRLAFVTDRFSTHLPTLHAGRLELALIDPASGRVESLHTFDRGKSINPQWAPGGRTIYFLSDATGITNVYAVDVGSRALRRLTNLDAGASGITALSPALSASMDANRIAFSGYEEGRIGIYLLEGRDALAGVPAEPVVAAGTAAMLPPVTRSRDEVTALLNDFTTGLPPEVGEAEPYRARLSLDVVGQPYVAAGVDRFGGLYGGGLSFALSDMLGNHRLSASIDTNTYGGISDIYRNTGAVLSYANLSRRWNWGLSGGQVPYLTGGLATGITSVNGQPAVVEQETIFRQVFRGVDGQVSYPFSEARRVEIGAGFQQVSFDRQVRTFVTSARTGQLLSQQTDRTSLGDPLSIGTATLAMVYDTSVFGATSPVSGQRSRFQVSPAVGSLTYTTALADYRRYVMPARFYTVAGRVMHYGRYGGDSDSGVLLPLFLGYPELVRGYGLGSFRASECTAGSSGSCDAYDRLLGSRMLVGNLEFRFPLLRPFGGMYGPVPVEVAFFADGGVAWTSATAPSFLGGERRPVSSGGVSLRANLFGFAVLQTDLAYPFQRPGRGWVWGFSFAPGF